MKIKFIDNEIITKKLDNGLDVYIINDENSNTFSGNFITKYGSNILEYNDLVIPKGTAHFLEHVMFASEDGDYFDKYKKYHGNANAYTTYDYTNYLFSCEDNFLENLGVLIDLVTNSYFTKEVVDKEFKIISEEILMYDKQPMSKIMNMTYKTICNHSNYKYDICGTISDIEQITPELLNEVYSTFYVPTNQALVLYGNFNDYDLDSFLQRRFSSDIVEFKPLKYKKENSNINIKELIDYDSSLQIDHGITAFKFDNTKYHSHKYAISLRVFKNYMFSKINSRYYDLITADQLPTCSSMVLYKEDIFALLIKYEGEDIDKYHQNIVNYINEDHTDLVAYALKDIKASFIYSVENLESFTSNFVRLIATEVDINEYLEELYSLEVEDVVKYIKEVFNDYSVTYSALKKEMES